MEGRRFQVFVSSTFLDLKDERAAVVSALLQLEAIPAGMELFPAADDDAWTLIKKVIDDCDYYLLVIGGRYGSTDPDDELSYTEKEFDYAVRQKKPVMAFMHGEPDEIPVGKSDKDDEARAKLDAFRSKVETSKHVKYWKSASELAGQVALSFGLFKQNYPAIGWIRGDAQTSSESLSELNDLRKQLEKAEYQLDAARSEPPPGSDQFAQGAEPASISPRLSVKVHTKGMANSWQTVTYNGDLAEDVSWDELFNSVGPDLFDEASEGIMSRRLEAWLAERFGDAIVDRVNTSAEKNGDPVEDVRSVEVLLSNEDFGTLLVQLRALGLIRKSERNRSVNDKGTYWSLTPYGEEHLTNLRAIRRSEVGVPSDEGDQTNGALEPAADHSDDIPF